MFYQKLSQRSFIRTTFLKIIASFDRRFLRLCMQVVLAQDPLQCGGDWGFGGVLYVGTVYNNGCL